MGWELTVGDGHHDPAHELRLLHVGILPVQQHARRADLARGAVEGVELVGRPDAVHHRAILPQVRVDSHHLPKLGQQRRITAVLGINSRGASLRGLAAVELGLPAPPAARSSGRSSSIQVCIFMNLQEFCTLETSAVVLNLLRTGP